MSEMSIYEIIMLICFGVAWPLSIYKMIVAKSGKGKSITFLIAIILGYVCGVMHKIEHDWNYVVYLYVINALMVAVDLFLVVKYNRKDARERQSTDG